MSPPIKDTGTRARLLEIGAEAISEKSFNSCGLAEILERARVPKGSFYHYFKSKEEFGVALIEKETVEFVDELRPLIGDRKKSPLERLRSIFEMMRDECVARGAARQCLIPKLALETGQLSEPVQAAIKAAYDQWRALLAQVLREAQAAGELSRSCDPDRLAGVLVMLWEGTTMHTQIVRSMEPIDDFLEFVFGSLLQPREAA